MKKVVITMCLALVTLWSVGAMAENIGVINMQTIFKMSPKAQSIDASLKKQFSERKANIIKMGKDLNAEIQSYKKNQTVLSKADLEKSQQQITKSGIALRQAQAKFRSDLLIAQNKKTRNFVNQLKVAAKQVALKKNLDLILASNAVLYSKNKLDITSSILSAMK